MNCPVIIFSILITIIGFYVEDSSQRLVRCPVLRISNGRPIPRNRGRGLRFKCNTGYTLVGNKVTACSNGIWTNPAPICVSTKCALVENPDNTLMVQTYDGGLLMFFCDPGYQRIGSPAIYCDGTSWNATAPTCTKDSEVKAPTRCDFEDPNICLWEQDPTHDFDWRRHNFNTPSWHVGTGPSYDHTFGQGRNGYYLYIEATAQLENSTARIMSPLYSSNLTEAGCFSFWYHMYGRTIGTLNVYFRIEGATHQTLLFTKSGNQGNHWLQGFFQLPNTNSSFQIILEGVRGTSYLSDIAVDDVAILQGNDCILNLHTTTESINSTDDGYDQVEIVNGMQSCLGRCTYSNATEDPTSVCQCDLDCADNQNCCLDYQIYCFDNDTVDFTTEYLEETTIRTMVPELPSMGPDRVPIPINPKDDIDPYPPKIPKKELPTTATTTKKTPKIPQVTYPKAEITTTNLITLSPDVTKTTTNKDKFDNQIGTDILTESAHSISSRDHSKVTLPGIIAIVVGAIVGVGGTGLIVFMILQKRNSYKSKSSTSALSDDSDVRFLTSDEMLDFNLAKPEDMEL